MAILDMSQLLSKNAKPALTAAPLLSVILVNYHIKNSRIWHSGFLGAF